VINPPNEVAKSDASPVPANIGQLRQASVLPELRHWSDKRLIGRLISSRITADVRTIQNVLTPFISFDDGSPDRDDENKKKDCCGDHDHNSDPFKPRIINWRAWVIKTD
jgi:hypothetical protein